MKSLFPRPLAALFVCLGTTLCVVAYADKEFGSNTPYYEDDAWYDVSEWFDGNDYNPTDERWYRWDDETYQAAKDTGSDRDNDGWYGYRNNQNDRWFYDYYDPYPYSHLNTRDNNFYDYGYRYYDYDNDGIYDAYASYTDWDQDGLYDDYDYYSFSNSGSDKQRKSAKDQVSKDSRRQSATGKIEKRKEVQVRGGKKHLVVAIEPEGAKDKQNLMADLGRTDELKNVQIKEGDKITVQGPKAHVGKHDVIFAQSVTVDGKTTQISREAPKRFTGKVLSTHETKSIRGKKHRMAMVETSENQKTRKVAVDLGPADQLKAKVEKGTSLTFTGVPVKVKNKTLIMAQTIRQDDRVININRQLSKNSEQKKNANQ
jgi:hypothetical protein